MRLWLLVLAALLVGACPPHTNCSWTHGLTWTPAVPGTVTISWATALLGPVDHSRTADASLGQTTFEVTNGSWYVTISLVSADGSVQATTVTYLCVDDTDCVQLGAPAAPTGFIVT